MRQWLKNNYQNNNIFLLIENNMKSKTMTKCQGRDETHKAVPQAWYNKTIPLRRPSQSTLKTLQLLGMFLLSLFVASKKKCLMLTFTKDVLTKLKLSMTALKMERNKPFWMNSSKRS